jgi:hypothetical protein
MMKNPLNMTTWTQCLSLYNEAFDIYDNYLTTQLGNPPLVNYNERVKFSFLERFHINFIVIQDLIPMVEEHAMKFLSLGLVLRGTLSDVINYRYLNKVLIKTNEARLSEEIQILDRNLVEAYGEMTRYEVILANRNVEPNVLKAALAYNNEILRRSFPDFFNENGDLKKDTEIRDPDFAKLTSRYIKFIHKKKHSIGTETGKMKFVNDTDSEIIGILYKYMSQLQHYSFIGTNFYKMDGFVQFNPHLTLLVLYHSVKVIKAIIADVKPHEPTEQALDQFIAQFL